ncbi:unnamed protein product, partial [Polarella glacialis]
CRAATLLSLHGKSPSSANNAKGPASAPPTARVARAARPESPEEALWQQVPRVSAVTVTKPKRKSLQKV